MKEYVVITGASSGIGYALAMCFANSNSNLIAIGRNEIPLQRIKLSARNKHITVVVADLSIETELEKIANILKRGDKIKFLIHCAATIEPRTSLATASRAELEKAISVNVMAPIFLTQKLASYFDETMTRVLFIGSDYVGVSNKIRPHITGAYGISKSALRIVVEYFRHEYKGVALIGYLNPGSTETPMFNAVKTAILNRNGIFKVEPAQPANVAKFIQTVLEASSDQDFMQTNWDYRNEEQHSRIVKNEISSTTLQSKL